jgi:tetratricopeptide (TPR) repeat protein
MNRPDSARHYVDKAMNLSPSWVLPYSSVAEGFFLNKNYELAEEMINKAAKIDSNSVLVLNTKGRIYREIKNYAEAEKMFLKVIEIEPQWSVPYKNLSYLYLIRGDFNNAEIMADQAILNNPSEIRAIQVLAWTYIYTNRINEAEALLIKARALDKNNTFYLDFDLSCYYSLTSRVDMAYKHLNRALELGYTNYQRLMTDSDLENMRADPGQWKVLMNKYFPDKTIN